MATIVGIYLIKMIGKGPKRKEK